MAAPDVQNEVTLTIGGQMTDSRNAVRLFALANGTIRFVEAWKSWIVYDDVEGHWVRDDTRARVNEVAKRVGLVIFNEAEMEMQEDDKKKMREFAFRSENKRAIDAMVDLAKGLPGLIIAPDDIDAKPTLFNVRNGTVDLLTGELHEHTPDDLLMFQAPVLYDRNARSALWDSCLERWQPDPETRGYLQRVCGTGISGDAVQNLFVNVGTGANGKSVAFEAITAVVGPFKVTPNKKLLTVQTHEGHATEIATLKGARLAVAAETSDNERLNEASIKNLTGGDTLTCRGMHENEWSFRPSHTMFLHTNYQPDIKGTDEGIWRRIRVIPWAVTIPESERDDRLSEKLRSDENKSAILNWLIDGYLAYRTDSSAPPEVERATQVYRQDEDVLGVFITERVSKGRGHVPNSTFIAEFHTFCDARGDYPASHIEISKRLRGLGFTVKRMTAGNVWLQMQLSTESTSNQDVSEIDVGSPIVHTREQCRGTTGEPTEPASWGLQEFLAHLRANYGHIYEAAARGEIDDDYEDEVAA